MGTRIEFVLFDLGGVLIEPGGVGPMRELSRIDTDEELWARWLSCRWVRRFEAGLCSPDAFAAGVVADWDLDLGPAAFLEEFSGWVNTPYEGALKLVASVRDDVGMGCLSNMNEVQWHANDEAGAITGAFALRFLSFELGLVKPDRRVFEAVASRLPVPRQRVLFLDDNAANVAGAEASGFEARHVRGVEEARRVLRAEGVLGS
jgi:HAD superfamily hydrolase (TIGR01509 family)